MDRFVELARRALHVSTRLASCRLCSRTKGDDTRQLCLVGVSTVFIVQNKLSL